MEHENPPYESLRVLIYGSHTRGSERWEKRVLVLGVIGVKDVVVVLWSLCSVKFMNKIQYVHSLDELAEIVPMEHVQVPECVMQ